MAQLGSLIVTGDAKFLNGLSGTLNGNATNVTGTVAVAHGGTGATTAANARTNLGIGSVGTLNYGTGTNTFLLNNGTWSTVVLPVNPSTKPTAVGAMWIET